MHDRIKQDIVKMNVGGVNSHNGVQEARKQKIGSLTEQKRG